MDQKSLLEAVRILEEGTGSLDITLSEKKINSIILYIDLLKKWNARINLTSIHDLDEIIIKHFIDSLTILKFIPLCSRVVDIGSGAGGRTGIPSTLRSMLPR